MRAILLLPLLVACEPPDPVDVDPEPEIELIYPPPDQPLVRDGDGTVRFTTVVYIHGVEFAPDLQGQERAEGQGHWHIGLENTYLAAPANLSYEVEHVAFAPPDLTQANSVHVRVSLQHNDHGDYNDPDGDGVDNPGWEQIIEYDIVDADEDTGL